MVCKNCGIECTDDMIFCSGCGTKLITDENCSEQNAVQEMTQETSRRKIQVPVKTTQDFTDEPEKTAPSEVYDVSDDFDGQKPKISKKILIPAIAAVVIVAFAAVGFAFKDTFVNFWMKTTGSPEEYFQYVMEKNMKDVAENMADATDVYKDMLSMDYDVNAELEIGGKVKNIVKLIGGDAEKYVGWLDKIGIEINTFVDDDASDTEIGISVNGINIGTVDCVKDEKRNMFYIGVPEATDTYIAHDHCDEIYDTQNLKIAELIPDRDFTAELYYRYLMCAVEEIDDVEKSNEDITVAGVDRKVTKLTAEIDKKTAEDIAECILKEFKSDKELEEIINDIAEASINYETPDEVYDEIIDEFEYTVDEIKDGEDFEEIALDFYVDGSGEIVGFHVGGEAMGGELTCYTATNDKNYGEFYKFASDDDFELVIEGNGKIKDGKKSGEYKVYYSYIDYVFDYDDYEYDEEEKEFEFEFSLSGVDAELYDKGILNGKLEFEIPDDAVENVLDEMGIPSMVSSVFSDISIVIDSETTEKRNPEFKVDLQSGGGSLLSLNISAGANDSGKISEPDKFAYEDHEKNSEVMDDIIKHMEDKLEEAGMPDEILSALGYMLYSTYQY